jgi:AcrR family transcriptional regulator
MEPDSKREKLLFTGQALFFKHGFRRISIEEICKEADVSKVTFYKHFKDKQDLIRSILLRLYEDGHGRYRAIVQSDDPYPEKVKALIRLKLEQSELVSAEALKDLMRQADPDLTLLMNDLRIRNTETWMNDFAAAQRSGDIRAGIHPEFIVYFINRMSEMACDESLLRYYPSPRDLIREMMEFFFYGTLARPENGRRDAGGTGPEPEDGAARESE